MTGQVVDTPSAQEFMSEILERVSDDELVGIASDLRRKSEHIQTLLGGTPAALSRDDLRELLGWVFTTRRRADRILDAVGAERLAKAIASLLDPRDVLPERIESLDRLLEAFPEAAFDLPGELLHFTHPHRYWLWSRWMWDPRTETGSLPLVVMEEFDLTGASRGETYLKVGEAVAFVSETGHAAGFTRLGDEAFGIDVFLASVYAIYMYTILRLRMTQEFNQVVPPLPELVRRLLGVHRMEV